MTDTNYLGMLDNVNIAGQIELVTPGNLKKMMPVTEKAAETIVRSRETIERILRGEDTRKILIIGPCSVHDVGEAREYALLFRSLAEKVSDKLFMVMRAYFEKPRTTVGWKGLVVDPHLNDSFEMNTGLKMARGLLLYLAEEGIPVGTEALSPALINYFADLVSWAAIGARTTESQTHREMTSGLSMPVGFKNGTDGGLEVAVNALLSSRTKHRFAGPGDDNVIRLFETKGNHYGHLILRGGNGSPNYETPKVIVAAELLKKAGLKPNVIVDCSHANKLNGDQIGVFDYVMNEIVEGRSPAIGAMLESNLNGGSQKYTGRPLEKGVSVTDKCISWPETEGAVLRAHNLFK